MHLNFGIRRISAEQLLYVTSGTLMNGLMNGLIHFSHNTSCALKTFLSEKRTSFQTTSTPSSVSMAREALSTPGTLPWLTCRGHMETHKGAALITSHLQVLHL